MADSLPTLKFKTTNVKVRLATVEEQAELQHLMKEQTSDLLAFVRRSDKELTEGKEEVPEGEIDFTEKDAMFTGKPKYEKKPKAAEKEKDEQAALLATRFQRAPAPTTKFATAQIKKLGKYEEDLQKTGKEIIEAETENPYDDTNENPIYPIRTRMGFQKQILKVFHRFMKTGEDLMKEPDFDACKKMALGAQQQVEMYEYQKFVREYIRQASPYRGVLVYHGLGSGKTCTAIAAAEALYGVSQKKIVVMTPSSLRDNFIREMTFCGFRHFRLQNYWVSLDGSDPMIQLFAREVLGLSSDYVKKMPTIWVPDFSEPEPNFNELTSAERQQVTQQVIQQIKARVTFINYNGISATRLKQIACAEPDKNGYRFFDNKIIVVDEVHNLTRLMQGTIDPYIKHMPGLKRKIAFEPIEPGIWNPALCAKTVDMTQKAFTNYHRGYLFYRLLATARDSKIIGLSGTPLINFPEELGILTNLLGGYVHTVKLMIKEGTPENKKILEDIFRAHPFIDFEEVLVQGSSLSIMFTLLPEGMTKAIDTDGSLGIQQTEKSPTIQEVTDEIVKRVAELKLTITSGPEFQSEPLLPPIGEDFRKDFLEEDGSTLKNVVVLRKRLQGLISYYRGSKKELMPAVVRDEVVRVPMSPYSQGEYMRVRNEELKVQMKKKSKKQQGALAGLGSKASDLWAQLYNLSTGKASNSYRMSSRQACNFVFPETIKRPRAQNLQDVNEEIGTGPSEEIIDDGDQQANEGLEIPKDAVDEDDVANAQKEEEELEEAEHEAEIQAAREAGDEEGAEELENKDKPDVIEELEPTGKVGDLIPAVAKGAKLSEAELKLAQQKKERDDCAKARLPGELYSDALRRAKKCLNTFALAQLRLYKIGEKTVQKFAEGAAPEPNQLIKYSPKYAAILQNILSAPGSSLVYSQFSDMEGIGIFTIAMKKNEFDPIELVGDYKTGYSFSQQTIDSFQKRSKRYRFITFTGGEHPSQRSLALRLFNAKYAEDEKGNGSFIELPPEMSKLLVDAGFKGNTLGELCRVFCITSAGAEGLSLRNVRRVHIMEPYWNHVRTDQVKGRAVRICSHVDLDYSDKVEENQRTVEVFTYCSVFDPQAFLTTGEFPPIDQTILNQDGLTEKDAKEEGFPIPSGAKEYVITSDEYLHAISMKKKRVLENIQNVMKTAAVDCELNVIDNKDDGLGCVTLGGQPEQYAFHPILQKDIEQTAIEYKAAPEPKPSQAVHVEDTVDMGVKAKPSMPLPQSKFIKARKITYAGKPYLAVPVKEPASGFVLYYNLFDINDITQKKVLGTAQADAKGQPTADITLK